MIITPPAKPPARDPPLRPEIHRRQRSWPPLRRCPATLTVSAILTAVFLVEWMVGAFAFENPLPMLALGANSTELVKAGEWHRLVTANLLHGGFLHFFLNVVALLYMGGILELVLGARRFLAVLLVSCLGGSIASTFLTQALIAVGVSTGLLGLIAANLVLTWRFAEDRRRMLKSLVFLVFVVVAISLPFEWLLARLLFSQVDHFGHLGGFVAGFLYTVVTMRERSAQELRRTRRDPIALAVAAGLSIVFVATAAWTGFTYATKGLSPTAESFLATIDMPDDDDGASLFKFFFNNAAWTLATDPDSTREQLETAFLAMRWVEGEEPSQSVAERDTLATIRHRLGNHEAAIGLERQVLELAQSPEVIETFRFGDDDFAFFASQLARFEWARYQASGPVTGGLAELPDAFLVRPEGESCAEPREVPGGASNLRRGLLLRKGAWGRAAEIHVVLVRDAAPAGFVQVVAGADAPVWLEYGKLGGEMLDCGVRAVVTLAEVARAPIGDGDVEWRFWSMAEDAAALP